MSKKLLQNNVIDFVVSESAKIREELDDKTIDYIMKEANIENFSKKEFRRLVNERKIILNSTKTLLMKLDTSLQSMCSNQNLATTIDPILHFSPSHLGFAKRIFNMQLTQNYLNALKLFFTDDIIQKQTTFNVSTLSSIENVLNSINELNRHQDALESNYQNLVTKYQNLESKYQNLESKCQNLESKYQILKKFSENSISTLFPKKNNSKKTLKLKDSITYELKEDDLLYFLHIPKTAGTTFISVLESYFDFKSILPEKVWPALLKNKPKNFSKLKFVRGHFGYGIYRILGKKPVTITMLRDPISRTISSYDHVINYPIGNNWVPDNFIPKNKSLLQILNDPLKKIFFQNEQTRHLGLDLGELLSTEERIKELGKENNLLGSMLKCKIPLDKELLEIAKHRLQQFTYFGLTERFEESLFLLYYTFGWKPNRSIWKMMITGKTNKNEVSVETLSAIKNCLNLDFKLYEFAKELFQSRFIQMVNELKEKYFESKFDKLSFNEMMYEMLEINFKECVEKLKIPKVNNINFDFGQKMFGSGWYYREYCHNNKICRWTGPGTESTLEFPLLNDKDLKIKFNVVDQASIDILNSVKLMINNFEIYLTLTRNNETFFEGIIPKSLIQKRTLTKFTFSVSHTKEIKQNITPEFPKTRKVGIAIANISISL